MKIFLESIRESFGLPALAGGVVTSHGLKDIGAFGLRKYGNAAAVTLNDQFHLGSNTKAMTATLLAILVQEGKLSWDSTLGDIFPELADIMDPAYRHVSLDLLLSHRAGFASESAPANKSLLDLHQLTGSPKEQRLKYISMILKESPDATGLYRYSNRSYAVAGAVAERICDVSWELLMKTLVFEPLGILTGGFGAMGSPGNVDAPWQHAMVGTQPRPIEPGLLADNPIAIGPAGSIHCSIGDWCLFLQQHLAGEQGKSVLLEPETTKDFTLHQTADFTHMAGS